MKLFYNLGLTKKDRGSVYVLEKRWYPIHSLTEFSQDLKIGLNPLCQLMYLPLFHRLFHTKICTRNQRVTNSQLPIQPWILLLTILRSRTFHGNDHIDRQEMSTETLSWKA